MIASFIENFTSNIPKYQSDGKAYFKLYENIKLSQENLMACNDNVAAFFTRVWPTFSVQITYKCNCKHVSYALIELVFENKEDFGNLQYSIETKLNSSGRTKCRNCLPSFELGEIVAIEPYYKNDEKGSFEFHLKKVPKNIVLFGKTYMLGFLVAWIPNSGGINHYVCFVPYKNSAKKSLFKCIDCLKTKTMEWEIIDRLVRPALVVYFLDE